MAWIYNEGALKAKFERLEKLSQQNKKKLEKVASRNEPKFQMTKEEYNKYKAILFKKSKDEKEENKELQRQARLLKELEEEYRQYDAKYDKELEEPKEKAVTTGLIRTVKKNQSPPGSSPAKEFRNLPNSKAFLQDSRTLRQGPKTNLAEADEDLEPAGTRPEAMRSEGAKLHETRAQQARTLQNRTPESRPLDNRLQEGQTQLESRVTLGSRGDSSRTPGLEKRMQEHERRGPEASTQERMSPRKKDEQNLGSPYGNIKILGRARSPEASNAKNSRELHSSKARAVDERSQISEAHSPLESYLKIKFDEINSIIKKEKSVPDVGGAKAERSGQHFSLVKELEIAEREAVEDEDESDEDRELKRLIAKLESERSELENRLVYLDKVKARPGSTHAVADSPKRPKILEIQKEKPEEIDFEKRWEALEKGSKLGARSLALTPRRSKSDMFAKKSNYSNEGSPSQDLNDQLFSNKSSPKGNDLLEFELLLSRSSEKKRESPRSSEKASPRTNPSSAFRVKSDAVTDKESIDKLAEEIESLMSIQKNFKDVFEESRGRPEEQRSAGKRPLWKYRELGSNQLFEIEEVSIENSVSMI